MSSKAVLHYTPEGGSKRSWEINLENPAWDIAYNTEVATGWPWVEFSEKLSIGSAIALRALVWTLRKRDEPKLPLQSVQVTFGEIDVDYDEDDDTDPAEESAEGEVPKAPPLSKKSKPTDLGSNTSSD